MMDTYLSDLKNRACIILVNDNQDELIHTFSKSKTIVAYTFINYTNLYILINYIELDIELVLESYNTKDVSFFVKAELTFSLTIYSCVDNTGRKPTAGSPR